MTPESTHALRRTVLVVDDVTETRDLLVGLLQRNGYETLAAGDGRTALTLLEQHATRVCAVVLDLMMPGSDGWWFREEQLKSPAISAIPVVVFTAARKTDIVKYALRLSEVLYKPAPPEDLLEAIRRHCQASA